MKLNSAVQSFNMSVSSADLTASIVVLPSDVCINKYVAN
jgi:hypothetical protein